MPAKNRSGIYVLGFEDDEQYVGQTVELTTRFASHRRRWSDISTLEWHPCAKGVLSEREQQVIAGRIASGAKLRNIRHARGPLGVSPLDSVVTRDEQLAWINGEDPFDGADSDRLVDEEQRLKKRASFEKLQKHEFFTLAALALNAFVSLTIPRPAATERQFWVLTAMPGTNRSKGHQRLATLSINKVEVFWLFATEMEGQRFFWGQLQLSRSQLTDRLGTTDFGSALLTDPPEMLAFEEAGYETSGGDGLRIRFFSTSWFDLLQNRGVVEAARSFNLMLLRKGTSPLGHHHNYDLTDWAIDPDPFEWLNSDLDES